MIKKSSGLNIRDNCVYTSAILSISSLLFHCINSKVTSIESIQKSLPPPTDREMLERKKKVRKREISINEIAIREPAKIEESDETQSLLSLI